MSDLKPSCENSIFSSELVDQVCKFLSQKAGRSALSFPLSSAEYYLFLSWNTPNTNTEATFHPSSTPPVPRYLPTGLDRVEKIREHRRIWGKAGG